MMEVSRVDGSKFSGSFQNFEKPCILLGLTDDWRAVKEKRWSLDELKVHYGKVSMSCWNCLNIKDPIVNMPMEEFINKYVLNATENNVEGSMLYLNDKFFETSCPEMVKDYLSPSMFKEYERLLQIASFARRILIGPTNSHTYLHVDNLYTSAWNTVVVGRKYWIMIEPKLPQSSSALDASESDYDCCTDEVMKVGTIPQMIQHLQSTEPTRPFVTFIQHPGDTVYIPAQWYHAVVNIDHTVGVSHAFVQPRHLEQHLKMALCL